jgi:hypothetical protein
MMDSDIEKIKHGILIKGVDSWKRLVDFVADPKQSWSTLIYRGQANASWKVTSTLDRLEAKFPRKLNSVGDVPDYFECPPVSREIQLERFKDIGRHRLAAPIPENEEDEWWAIAQHHGMATPMLDWTYSPFVALYFAFEDEKCDRDGQWRTPDSRAVFALTAHLLPREEVRKQHPKPFAPKRAGNYRITSQWGLFLRMPEPEHDGEGCVRAIDLESYVSKQFSHETYSVSGSRPNRILQKFVIPSSAQDRLECLRFLDHMNINRASLFPDLDGAARYVNALWEVNWDKAIGYINNP